MTVVRTLHRAGNRRAVPPLSDLPIDAIEADAWVVRGQVVLQHARPLGGLPLSLHRRGIFLESQRRSLEGLLAQLDPRLKLVLDVRAWVNDPTPDIFTAIAHRPAEGPTIAFSSEAWGIADRLGAWLPEHASAYSVRSEAQLRRYIEGRNAGTQAAMPVAIRHTLLRDASEVEALRRFTPRVAAWTVDDVERARALAAWGVDEIVSNRIEVLAAL